jgi:hypothetical protein
VDEYWNFCDMEGLHVDKDITPAAHKLYRYARELPEVIPMASEAAKRYYERMFEGCSMAQLPGHRYVSEDGVFCISWFLPDEAAEFLAELQPYESQLMSGNDAEAGVLWVLESLKRATREGLSLVVTIA